MRVLADVREALGHEVVGGDLERARAAGPRARRCSRTGTGARAASCSSATASPCPLTTAGWMPRATSRSSSSDVAISGAPDRAARSRRIVGQPLLQQAELERERDEPLLCAVVQVALESLPLLLAGLDDPRARAPELFEAGPQLGVQRAFSSAIPAAAVTARAARARLAAPGRGAAPRRGRRRGRSASSLVRSSCVRQLHWPAVEIGVAPELRQPVRERQRRIAKRPCERVAEIGRCRIGAQLDEESPTAERASRSCRSPTRKASGASPSADEGGPADRARTAGPPNAWRDEEERDHHQPEGERIDEQRERAAQRPARRACGRRGRRRRHRQSALTARAERAAPPGQPWVWRELEQVMRARSRRTSSGRAGARSRSRTRPRRDPLEPRSQPAARVREEDVQEEHRRQQVERLPDRERDVVGRPREVTTKLTKPAAIISGPKRLSGRRHQAISPQKT